VHGLAGFSHLIAVLPSLALPSRTQSVLYLAAFGCGTILAMLGYTILLGLVAWRLEEKSRHRMLKWITFAGGVSTVAIGIYWLARSGSVILG
jgi:sulfite exporter TauE/SafE